MKVRHANQHSTSKDREEGQHCALVSKESPPAVHAHSPPPLCSFNEREHVVGQPPAWSRATARRPPTDDSHELGTEQRSGVHGFRNGEGADRLGTEVRTGRVTSVAMTWWVPAWLSALC